MKRRHLILGAAFLVCSSSAGRAVQTPQSEETIQFFQQNCSSCHTIGGGRLAGPDLKDVSERADRDWLIRFLQDPKGVIDSGDPYARSIFNEARGIYMPATPGMNKVRAGKLLDLIDHESGLEKSRFAGMQVSDRPLTAQDVQIGEDLFLGRQAFASGAPACVSCHTLADMAGLGGGQLGPDLTTAFARLDGRKALSAWLSAPPTSVMQPIYKRRPIDGEEILPLVAYLKQAAQTGDTEAEESTLIFLLLGVALAAAILVAFDYLWRNRYHAVRRVLVAEN